MDDEDRPPGGDEKGIWATIFVGEDPFDGLLAKTPGKRGRSHRPPSIH